MTVEANVVKDICPCEGQKGKAKASEFGEGTAEASGLRMTQWNDLRPKGKGKGEVGKMFAFGSPSCDDDRTGGLCV